VSKLITMVAWLLPLGLYLETIARRRDGVLPAAGRFVDAGGYGVRVYERGEGEPVVVIVHGAGDCASSWAHVQDEVSRFTRVIAYDRGGLGGSDRGPAPDLDHLLDELDAVLRRAPVRSPVILVGHSLGGLVARAYAERNRDRVAGLVLVDATPEAVLGSWGTRVGFALIGAAVRVLAALARFGLPRALLAAGMMPLYPEEPRFRAQISPAQHRRWVADVCRDIAGAAGDELRAVLPAARAAAARGARSLGDLPLVVISSPNFGEAWHAWQAELSTRSRRGSLRTSHVSGHNVHMAQPELVIDAIRELVAEVKRRGSSSAHEPPARLRAKARASSSTSARTRTGACGPCA
jgi:pimeloyl-ACP methyl ester carboxylesterase